MQWALGQKNCNQMNYLTQKNLHIVIVFLFVSTITFAQKIWMDDNWKETAKNSASFYRTNPKKLITLFEILHYYKNGNLMLKGYSKSAWPSKDDFEGIVTIYYDTGEVKEERFYDDGKRDGVWKSFHKSGKIKTKGKYRNGEKVGVWKTFYKNVYEDYFQLDINNK